MHRTIPKILTTHLILSTESKTASRNTARTSSSSSRSSTRPITPGRKSSERTMRSRTAASARAYPRQRPRTSTGVPRTLPSACRRNHQLRTRKQSRPGDAQCIRWFLLRAHWVQLINRQPLSGIEGDKPFPHRSDPRKRCRRGDTALSLVGLRGVRMLTIPINAVDDDHHIAPVVQCDKKYALSV